MGQVFKTCASGVNWTMGFHIPLPPKTNWPGVLVLLLLNTAINVMFFQVLCNRASNVILWTKKEIWAMKRREGEWEREWVRKVLRLVIINRVCIFRVPQKRRHRTMQRTDLNQVPNLKYNLKTYTKLLERLHCNKLIIVVVFPIRVISPFPPLLLSY